MKVASLHLVLVISLFAQQDFMFFEKKQDRGRSNR